MFKVLLVDALVKFVVIEVLLFSVVAFTTLTFHKVHVECVNGTRPLQMFIKMSL